MVNASEVQKQLCKIHLLSDCRDVNGPTDAAAEPPEDGSLAVTPLAKMGVHSDLSCTGSGMATWISCEAMRDINNCTRRSTSTTPLTPVDSHSTSSTSPLNACKRESSGLLTDSK